MKSRTIQKRLEEGWNKTCAESKRKTNSLENKQQCKESKELIMKLKRKLIKITKAKYWDCSTKK